MELKEQLTSLAPSKRLKELGVKQESECYFAKDLDNEHIGWHLFRINEIILEGREPYYLTPEILYDYSPISAFSVAENDDALPCEIIVKGNILHLIIRKHKKGFHYAYYDGATYLFNQYPEKQADAGSLLRIWLVENKLIDV